MHSRRRLCGPAVLQKHCSSLALDLTIELDHSRTSQTCSKAFVGRPWPIIWPCFTGACEAGAEKHQSLDGRARRRGTEPTERAEEGAGYLDDRQLAGLGAPFSLSKHAGVPWQ